MLVFIADFLAPNHTTGGILSRSSTLNPALCTRGVTDSCRVEILLLFTYWLGCDVSNKTHVLPLSFLNFSVSLHWVGFWFTWKAFLVIISILLSLFSLLSLFPGFSENELIKNMELLLLNKVPWGLQRSPSRKVARLHLPCGSTDPQVSPLAKMDCMKKKKSYKIYNSSSNSSESKAQVGNKLCLQTSSSMAV